MTEEKTIKMKQIKLYAKEIAESFKPEKIILFGSYAYGKPTKNSDIDLLIIMNFEGKSINKAVEIIDKINPNFSLDLIVRTPKSISERLKWNDQFLHEIIKKGKTLYESSY